MTGLSELRRLAERAPVPRLPDDLWQRGRRRRRRRRTLAASAVIAMVAMAGVMPMWLTHGPLPAASRVEAVIVPSTLDGPLIWQATADADPNGPAKLVFLHGNNIGFEGGPVLIGADDSYRGLIGQPSDDLGAISRDGRQLAHYHHGRWEVLDTVTGTSRNLGLRNYWDRPLAFSPDGRRLLIKVNRNDDGITYGPDNQPLNDPEKPDDIVVHDVATGDRTLLLTEHGDNASGGFSPDGRRVAFSTGKGREAQTVHIVDLSDLSGKTTKIPLTTQQRLLGPESWTPDGGSVILAAATGCPWYHCDPRDTPGQGRWRLQRADATTGLITEDSLVRPGFPTSSAGWRGGDPVVTDSYIYDPNRTVLLRLRADGGTEKLLTLPAGGHGLLMPADVIERASFGGPPISPSILPAQSWAYLCLLAILMMVALPVAIVAAVRRRRRRAA